jgi:hypothetical protein
LNGEEIPLSNYGKALVELKIEHIKANTPQAKGRIERFWETLQDRLPMEATPNIDNNALRGYTLFTSKYCRQTTIYIF